MATQIQVQIDLPDRQPYEGNATQKQKQRIWELGFRDQTRIDALGKKQASAIIDQLYQTHDKIGTRRSARNMFTASVFLIAGSVAGAFSRRMIPAIRNNDTVVTLLVIGFLAGTFLLIWSFARWVRSRSG